MIELENNRNNVILKKDDGNIVEWVFRESDGKYFAEMHYLEYLNPEISSTLVVGKHIKIVELGEDKKKARIYWNKIFRHKIN